MPTPLLRTHPPLLHCGYALVAESILLEMISPPSHSTIHFIGTIINDNTGDVLEYQPLIKMDKHKHIWAHSVANKLRKLFQGIRNVTSTDTCFFIPKSHIQLTNAPPMAWPLVSPLHWQLLYLQQLCQGMSCLTSPIPSSAWARLPSKIAQLSLHKPQSQSTTQMAIHPLRLT